MAQKKPSAKGQKPLQELEVRQRAVPSSFNKSLNWDWIFEKRTDKSAAHYAGTRRPVKERESATGKVRSAKDFLVTILLKALYCVLTTYECIHLCLFCDPRTYGLSGVICIYMYIYIYINFFVNPLKQNWQQKKN